MEECGCRRASYRESAIGMSCSRRFFPLVSASQLNSQNGTTQSQQDIFRGFVKIILVYKCKRWLHRELGRIRMLGRDDSWMKTPGRRRL